jgi:tripeptide aminopeptidase
VRRVTTVTVAGIVLILASNPGTAQDGGAIAELLRNAAVKSALAAAKANEPQTVEDQIRFCEIPAPPFKETARGEELKRTFQQLGLQNVRVDKAGNVLGYRPGVRIS